MDLSSQLLQLPIQHFYIATTQYTSTALAFHIRIRTAASSTLQSDAILLSYRAKWPAFSASTSADVRSRFLATRLSARISDLKKAHMARSSSIASSFASSTSSSSSSTPLLGSRYTSLLPMSMPLSLADGSRMR